MLVAHGVGSDSSEEPSDKAPLAPQIHPSSDGETPSLKSDSKPQNSAGPMTQNMDMSSVITQVTREASQPVQRPAPFRVEQPLQRPSWNMKLRSFLLCCFAPQTNGYTRTRENENNGNAARSGGSINRHHPPTAPKYNREAVIGPKHADDTHKKTLVLDLDETLVHSSFKPIPNPDYIIPVEIDGKMVDVYVLKRPWMDHFMESISLRFEIIVFTASLSKYADPLLDLLDKTKVVRWRLFRESCFPYEGNYVKDLTWLGRDLSQVIIVDNSPHSYVFQPANAVAIGTFIDNMEDQELLEILPVLNQIEHVADVRQYLGAHPQPAAQ